VQEQIAALQADLQQLVTRTQTLDEASREIERKGSHGHFDLLQEFIGRRVEFTLDDGRKLEGTLVHNQLRCLKIETVDEGPLVLNTLLINALTPIDDGGGPDKKKAGKSAKS